MGWRKCTATEQQVVVRGGPANHNQPAMQLRCLASLARLCAVSLINMCVCVEEAPSPAQRLPRTHILHSPLL